MKEKFVENFTRRYSESTLFIGTKYTISFFDIIEVPPKVTIMIDTGLEQYRIYNDTSNYNVVNNLTGILEFTGKIHLQKIQVKFILKIKHLKKHIMLLVIVVQTAILVESLMSQLNCQKN